MSSSLRFAFVLALLFPADVGALHAQESADSIESRVVDNPLLRPEFSELAAKRADGSEARIFVTEAEADGETQAPLLIYVEGSGAQSLFYKLDDGRIALGLLGLIAERVDPAYQVAAVEKRGVAFGYMGNRGASDPSLTEYNRHATLRDRAADIRLLIAVLLDGDERAKRKVVLLGHSEGADVAARVAADDERVTHIAFLSGGGPAQFFDLFLMERNHMRAAGASDEDIEIRMDELEAEIRGILDKPDSETDFFMGHAYKRWASFATTGAADSLVRTNASIFLAHGSADSSVPIESFDYLVVRLLCAGQTDVTVRRFADRDHSFIPVGAEPSYDGFFEVLDQVIDWADEG